MPVTELSLVAVFFTGLLGGVHCAGMCGGIVSALGMVRQRPVALKLSTRPDARLGAIDIKAVSTTKAPSNLASVSLYNVGRIGMYVSLGTMAGGVGSVAWLMESMLPVQQFAYLISNVLLILMGLYITGIKGIATVVESLGAHFWKWVRPAATRQISRQGGLNNVLTGALWGLVPCGMVYAVLSVALVSGSAANGALLMLVFGLGTLPNLMLLGMSGKWLARASKNLWVRRLAGALIIGFGLMGFLHLSMMSHPNASSVFLSSHLV